MTESARKVAENLVHGLVNETIQVGCVGGSIKGIRALGLLPTQYTQQHTHTLRGGTHVHATLPDAPTSM